MILKKLTEKFSEIKNVFFEKEGENVFLRIEVNQTDLTALTSLSRKISRFLDHFENEVPHKHYFLDVYSTGTDTLLDKDNLTAAINQNVQVILNEPVQEHKEYIGILITDKPITLKWNNKGQFRKIVIPIATIKTIKLYAKLNN